LTVVTKAVVIALQDPDPWLLMIADRSGKSGWFRKAKEPSDVTLNSIHEMLNKAGKLSNISWFTREQYESGAQVGNPTQ
jgi:hypothetical protein